MLIFVFADWGFHTWGIWWGSATLFRADSPCSRPGVSGIFNSTELVVPVLGKAMVISHSHERDVTFLLCRMLLCRYANTFVSVTETTLYKEHTEKKKQDNPNTLTICSRLRYRSLQVMGNGGDLAQQWRMTDTCFSLKRLLAPFLSHWAHAHTQPPRTAFEMQHTSTHFVYWTYTFDYV